MDERGPDEDGSSRRQSAVATDLPAPPQSSIATDLPAPPPSSVATDPPRPQAAVVTDLPLLQAAIDTDPPPPDPGSERVPRLTIPRPTPRARDPDALGASLVSGTILMDRYRIVGMLGRGAMGTVLEAHDERLDREVAIKLLHPDVARRNEHRLQQEAQALAQLNHPNVIRVYGCDTWNGRLFIVMELVRGRSLRAWQSSEPRPRWEAIVEAYQQAGRGLAAAHEAGLVHRDFNPSNCIRDDAGGVRVLDFGLARSASSRSSSQPDPSGEDTEESGVLQRRLTGVGAVLGTLAYMPFERLQGHDADARSDQFGFCVSLYEALHGQRPFEGDGAFELVLALERGELRPDPRDTPVPRSVRAVLRRGLALRPDDRWPSMSALLDALARARGTRSRTRLLAVAVASAAVTTGLALALFADDGAHACPSSSERLRGVWDDDLRERVRRSMLDTRTSYAADTWAILEPRLDAHAEAWGSAHAKACDAVAASSSPSRELDARMLCLERRLDELGAMVELLASADATVVRSSITAMDELPSVAQCEHESLSEAELALRADPARREQVDALEQRLTRVDALTRAGLFTRALEEARAVRAAALPLDHTPLVVDAGLAVGLLLTNLAKFEEAAEIVEPLYFVAKEAGLEREAAWLATRLTFLQGHGLGNFDEAMAWAKHAEASIPHTGAPRLAAHLDGMVGVLLASRGDMQEAEPVLVRALSRLEEQDPGSSPHLAAIGNLANFYSNSGDPARALPMFERVLSLQKTRYGPRHPTLAITLNNIAATHYNLDDYESALEAVHEALAINEPALGAEHPLTTRALDFLANIEVALQRHDDALEHARRALSIREGISPPSTRDLAESHTTLGNLYTERGELEPATEHARRAVELGEEQFGPEHPRLTLPLDNLANVELRRGNGEAAQRYFERVIAIFDGAYGPGHPNSGSGFVGVGRALALQGDPEGAVTALRKGIALLEARSVPPSDLGRARFELATALHASGTPVPEVLEIARRARSEILEVAPADDELLAELDAWVGALDR